MGKKFLSKKKSGLVDIHTKAPTIPNKMRNINTNILYEFKPLLLNVILCSIKDKGQEVANGSHFNTLSNWNSD